MEPDTAFLRSSRRHRCSWSVDHTVGSEGRGMVGKQMRGALSASWWHRSNWGTLKASPVSLGPTHKVKLGDFLPDDGDESDFLATP